VKTLVPSSPCRRNNSIVPLASAAQGNLTSTHANRESHANQDCKLGGGGGTVRWCVSGCKRKNCFGSADIEERR